MVWPTLGSRTAKEQNRTVRIHPVLRKRKVMEGAREVQAKKREQEGEKGLQSCTHRNNEK